MASPRRGGDLGKILDITLGSAQLHRAPQKRLRRPGRHVERSRITIMFGEDVGSVLAGIEDGAQLSARPRRKCPYFWWGLSLFPRRKRNPLPVPREGPPTCGPVYVGKNDVLYDTIPVREDVAQAAQDDVKLVCMAREAFLLKMKASGQELDPKWFTKGLRRLSDPETYS